MGLLDSLIQEIFSFHTYIAMALQPTMPAPKFTGMACVNGQFKEISLDDYKGKYVVLFFYPLDFTFVCPTEIIAFSDLAWCEKSRKAGGLGDMNIPLLAGKSMAISRAYGVLKEGDGIAFRGLFIIDGNGTLRQITVNDLP